MDADPVITTEPSGDVVWVKRDGKTVGWYSTIVRAQGVYASRDVWPLGTTETYKPTSEAAIAWIMEGRWTPTAS